MTQKIRRIAETLENIVSYERSSRGYLGSNDIGLYTVATFSFRDSTWILNVSTFDTCFYD